MTDRATVEERYSRANNSSNLTVDEIRTGDADVLIAAGWARHRIGSALLRLHSEWDGAEKPRLHARTPEARAWLMHEQMILVAKLKTMPALREQVGIQAEKWGWPEPYVRAAEILLWWLDQTCHACRGACYELIPGTNRLGNKACKICQGAGKSRAPHGLEGKRLANWMDECIQIARTQIKKHLHTHPISC
jgi:hypothetical protein